jgi:PAS domain S-box-containing protein
MFFLLLLQIESVIDVEALKFQIMSKKQSDKNDLFNEVNLEESEVRFRNLAESTPIGIMIYQGEYFVYANPACKKIFGYEPEELYRMHYWDLVDKEFRSVIIDRGRKRLAGENVPGEYQFQMRTKTGEEKWILINGTTIDFHGKPAGLVTLNDITERKHAEDLLEESEKKFRTLFEGANDSIFIMSEEEFIECNDMTLKIFGCDEKNDIIHHFPWEFSPDKQPDGKLSSEKAKKYIHAALKGKPQRFYWKHIRKNGILFDAEVSLNRLEIGKGRYLQAIVRDITERMQSEEALKLSEERYRLLVEQSPLPMGLADMDKNILYLNDQFIKLFGYTLESIPTVDHFFNVAYPDEKYRKFVLETWNCVLKNKDETGSPVPVHEFRITCKDGTVRIAELSATFIGENVLTTFHDVTMRKEAEKALLDSEAKYRLLAEHMTDMVWLMDMKLTTLYVSPSVEKLRGYTMDEILKLKLEEHLTPESLRVALNIFKNEIVQVERDPNYAKVTNVDLEFWKKDGTTVWLECSFSLIRDENGNPSTILGEGKDITERKQAEAVKERDRQIQKALNEILRISAGSISLDENLDQVLKIMLTAPFLAVSRQGCIFLSDEKYTELILRSGYKISEVLKKLCARVPFGFCVCGRTASTREIQYCDSNDKIHDRHLPDEKAHGHYCIPIIAEDKVLGVILIYFPDAHVQEQFEVDFYRAVADILSGVIQRKRAETELVSAKERAEASDHLKTAFLNNISHELRTPLNGILGFAEFVLQEGLSEEDKMEYLGFINENSDRLLNTVTNYMDSSLIASGNLEARKNPFILNQLFLAIDSKYQPVVSKKNLELRMQLPADTDKMTLYSDRDLIRKIIMHLIDNALKFTLKGHITFGYDIKPGKLSLFVRDTGPGIPKEARKRIFEPFVQGEVSNTRGYEGSGLGLSLAKGMTELLNGTITVESAINKGSSFSVAIPVSDSEMIYSEKAKGKVHRREEKNPVILVAEDDHFNFLYLEAVLKEIQVKIIHVVNGAEALDTCARNPDIALVLMDVKMPVMNGLEATRRIKAMRSDLPVVAVTAYALSSDEKLALNAGCNDYLPKPITRDQLLEKVRKYLAV